MNVVPHIVINKLRVKTSEIGIVDIFEDEGRGFALQIVSVRVLISLHNPVLE